MKNYKFSKQRKRILEVLQNTGTHPTATWIYDELRKDFPDLSQGTVYRNLNILIDQGLVKKIDFGSTFDRFDANTSEHYHFICEKCGAIYDLEMPIIYKLNEDVKDETNFEVHSHRIEFYGICEKCKRRSED